MKAHNKSLHLTAIPLRSIAAGELCRYVGASRIKNLIDCVKVQMIRNTVRKGTLFENKVYLIFQKMLESGNFLFAKNHCKLFQQKGYYSKDRQRLVKVDISIEVYLPDAEEWSILCVIECKDYNNKIPIDDIEEFKSKLDQIAGKNIKGIFCTSNSFQSSVFPYAQFNGIGLCRVIDDSKIRWDIQNEYYSPITWDKVLILKDDVKKSLVEEDYTANTNFIFSYYDNKYYFNFTDFFVDVIQYENRPNIPNIELLELIHEKKNLIKYLSNEEIEKITLEIISRGQEDKIISPQEILLDLVIQHIYQKYGFEIEENCDLKISPRGNIVLGKIDFDSRKILISKDISIDSTRGRFTLAHEIGHIVLHGGYFCADYRSEFSDDENDDLNLISSKMHKRIEIQARLFASSLLMPKPSVEKVLTQCITEYHLINKGNGLIFVDNQECNKLIYNSITSKFSKIYNVSKLAAANRLKNLGYLKYGEIKSWML